MTKRAKRIKKIFENPKCVPFKTLDTVLLEKGFKRRQPKSGSSHYVYYKESKQITVPYKRPFVKEIYVKQILELIGDEI
jgi:hypothetical protein